MTRRWTTCLAAGLCLFAAAPIVAASATHTSSGAMAKVAGCGHVRQRRCPHRFRRYGFEVHAFSQPVSSPRDAASGLASGKRIHKPVVH